MTPRKPDLHVVAAAVVRGNHCLIAQRQFDDSLPGRWEFPGGKVEAGESHEAALHREIMEELGTTISIERLIGRGRAEGSTRTILLDVFLAELVGPEPQALEHRALRWVKERELQTMRLAEADLFALDDVIRAMRAAR